MKKIGKKERSEKNRVVSCSRKREFRRQINYIRTSLTKDKVIRTKELPEWTSTDRIHRARLQIHEDCTWHVASTSCLIEVNVDTFKLQVRVSMVCS